MPGPKNGPWSQAVRSADQLAEAVHGPEGARLFPAAACRLRKDDIMRICLMWAGHAYTCELASAASEAPSHALNRTASRLPHVCIHANLHHQQDPSEAGRGYFVAARDIEAGEPLTVILFEGTALMFQPTHVR